jgi:hypothetical protein
MTADGAEASPGLISRTYSWAFCPAIDGAVEVTATLCSDLCRSLESDEPPQATSDADVSAVSRIRNMLSP